MKLFTQVAIDRLEVQLGLSDRIFILGSCFADNIGAKMSASGFDVTVNPFGTLYNPASIAGAISRLDSGKKFTDDDCVSMGAGADMFCSFEHHTSFARKTKEEFLRNANESLDKSVMRWKECNKVIITLGTARVWKRNGTVVSNCLKRPGNEFTSEMMAAQEIENILKAIAEGHTEKEFIITVSPIRHLGRGAHDNTVSKATLHIALDNIMKDTEISYFPAYEIFLDELRDYRFCTEDLSHPTQTAVEYIWERFLMAAVPESEHQAIREAEKNHLRSCHRPIHLNPAPEK